jgi:hypothetical protein
MAVAVPRSSGGKYELETTGPPKFSHAAERPFITIDKKCNVSTAESVSSM